MQDARNLLQVGEYERAAEMARAAIVESPTANAWTVLGQALAENGKALAAEHAFREAIALQPHEAPRARIALGLLRLHGEQGKTAREELQAVLDEFRN
ncbi:MAG: DUF1254 domain-containing protein, partial [Gammaproteobacteria bacterium]|nr:DUF1254 domain-containing protein [Gammaproteobacteria bacterium]